MRKRIRQLASGRLNYAEPELSFSVDKINMEVSEGDAVLGYFDIVSTNQIPIRGVVYSSNPRMECLTPQFEGEESRIRFQFHSEGLIKGDIQEGEFSIISNQCEYSLSFCVSIQHSYPVSGLKKITSLDEFINLAKENWQEAYRIFYSKEFVHLLSDSKHIMLYHGIMHARPCEQNFEEFLIGIKRKEEVRISVKQKNIVFSNLSEKRKECVEIKKTQWGYLHLEIKSESAFIELPKNELFADDFIGSTCIFEYYIDYEKLHEGKNFAQIIFSDTHQSLMIEILVHQIRENESEKKALLDEKRTKLQLVNLYQEYRLKRVVTGIWANKSIALLEHLQAYSTNEIYPLMKAQALIVNKQKQEAQWILDEFRKNCINRKSPVWGYYLYLLTLVEREASYVDKITHQIELIFHENPDSLLLFWILLFLEDEYFHNQASKLKAIEYWVSRNQNSPYLYVEAFGILKKNPYLLARLDSFEVKIIRWAIRKKALSKELTDRIFELICNEKEYNPVIFSIMKSAYEIDPSAENVGAICSYLIKGQKFESKYHVWYEKGIELELRITGLYEAFLISMDSREITRIPRIIQMYFQYESSLPYKKLAVLYNNIIAAKESEPEVYQSYQKAMGRFAMEQVELGHIDDNLSVLYREMLNIGLINRDIAHALSKILFTQKLVVFDTKLVRAIVYQEQIKEPQIVPIMEQESYIQIYSNDYVILFEDVAGHRYSESVEYRLQELFHPDEYLEKCIELAPEELSYTICYFNGKDHYTKWEKAAAKYLPRLLFSEMLSVEYQSRMIPEMLHFYQIYGKDNIIEKYLENVDPGIYQASARRYVTELLVEYRMYDKAYDLLQKYGMDQIGDASRVAVLCYMIEKFEAEEDEFLVQLAAMSFENRKYNGTILDYLCMYYHGSTERMIQIWNAANSFELNTEEIEERIVTQMLYTNRFSKEADTIFCHYIKHRSNELVKLAYLTVRANAFFIQQEKIEPDLFQMIKNRYISNLDLNDTCKLSLLKYYSQVDKHDLVDIQIEDEILAEYTRKNIHFSFYKKLDKQLVLKYQFYDKVFLEYHAKPQSHIVLHYSRDEDGQDFIAEDMQEVYDGIFVKPFVMFFGDMIQYYISEQNGKQMKVSETNRISNNDIYGEKDVSRYNLINQMLISKTLQDQSALYQDIMKYKKLEQITQNEFHIL